MKYFYLPLAIGLLATTTLQAKIKVVSHYNMGRVGNVSYASAPSTLEAIKYGNALNAIGVPVFYADAPADKLVKGEGAVLFSGKNEGYWLDKAYCTPGENLMMEVWAKPAAAQSVDGKLVPVLSNGNGKAGYVIGQQKDKWVLVSGGSTIATIGDLQKDQWTHLAIVVSDGEGSVWINGKESATFPLTKEFANNYSIASSPGEPNGFNGLIYEARLSTFKSGEFDPTADFLLNYKIIKEQTQQRKQEQTALLNRLYTPAAGKEFVTVFSNTLQPNDWLIQKVDNPCKLNVIKGDKEAPAMMQLNNGLVSRTFYVGDNVACVGYQNLTNGAEYIRAIKPETRVMIDSVWYNVGGLEGQPECSYLLEDWYKDLDANTSAFTLTDIETGSPLMRYPWKQKFNAVETEWPAKGLRVVMKYKPTFAMDAVKDLEVQVNYEIYQGLPVVVKWVEVVNNGDKRVVLNDIETEQLAINQDQVSRIHVESDFSFALVNGSKNGSALMHFVGEPKIYHCGESTTRWLIDSEYNTWASHNQAEDKFLEFPHHNLLVSTLPVGPDVYVDKMNPFKSFLTFELLQDSDDRERKSLGHRRMYKKLAPQVTESLISGGITSHDEKELKTFIDQMAELGLERLDIMAWPGISHDNLDEKYVQHWKMIADYAKDRGIAMGGYELQIASRGRGAEVDCISPETGKPGSLFGQSVCVASDWKDTYYGKMWEFFDKTGFKTYNMDGPYHGDPCAATNHKHHRGMNDSQWEQWKAQVEVIHELQKRDMYVPIPDWYFLNGQSATGMGYREASANLTPQQQQLLARQYIYDGTWHKLPTMGWMTLQLVGFYTNDPRVGLEPLCENLDRYESQLVQFLSSGAQLTIRGKRLYDTPQTKQMVSKWINWYKQYREILNSEIIHVSRPTGRDLDCIMHVNPFINDKGMVVVFNPTNRTIKKELRLPLYYAGLKNKAQVTGADAKTVSYTLNDKQEMLLPVEVKPGGTTWFVIK